MIDHVHCNFVTLSASYAVADSSTVPVSLEHACEQGASIAQLLD